MKSDLLGKRENGNSDILAVLAFYLHGSGMTLVDSLYPPTLYDVCRSEITVREVVQCV